MRKAAKLTEERDNLKIDLSCEKDESTYWIGLFSAQIAQLKVDLQKLRVEEQIGDTHHRLIKSSLGLLFSLARDERVHWRDLEQQVILIETLQSLRQEYQQL